MGHNTIYITKHYNTELTENVQIELKMQPTTYYYNYYNLLTNKIYSISYNKLGDKSTEFKLPICIY